MVKRRNFAVIKLRNPDNVTDTGGSFVVQASSPRGAFRVVRNNYAHMITNHVSRETHILECEGVKSDCRGILRINK